MELIVECFLIKGRIQMANFGFIDILICYQIFI